MRKRLQIPSNIATFTLLMQTFQLNLLSSSSQLISKGNIYLQNFICLRFFKVTWLVIGWEWWSKKSKSSTLDLAIVNYCWIIVTISKIGLRGKEFWMKSCVVSENTLVHIILPRLDDRKWFKYLSMNLSHGTIHRNLLAKWS